MPDYDFSSLNDKEFEHLSADLLTCHLGSKVERFKAGRDGGVDGRFFSPDGGEVIIQCKHWIKSGIPALIRSIEKTEAKKVRRLNPKRYIFVTSLELSRENKKTIQKLLAPHILTQSDIFGNEDLNDILSKNFEVEKRHYKLWISSTNVLKTILSSAIIGRSKHKLEEVVDESSRYVVTQSHIQARKKLEEIHSIIITGSPGVGKTSLADQLCQFYIANGYEFCFIENSLNEAEELYNEESKQVFYFDDFLGRNFLLALSSHQDSHVINFIKRVEKDKKKRFILTSRSNILNQGKQLSDLFHIKNMDKNEYELSITSLTDIDKAKILYNHIWFSDMNEGYIDEIYEEKRYLQIIKHKNFNPRLISFITDYHRLSAIKPKKYWKYIDETLSNPKDIWRNVFETQIDDISRDIVVAVSLHGQSISEGDLKAFFDGITSNSITANGNKNYEAVLRLLVGALMNRTVLADGRVFYDLFDPSIADFVISNYLSGFNYIDRLLICLRTPQSILNLKGLISSGIFDRKHYCNLLESQLVRLSKEQNSNGIDNYKLRILSYACSSLISPCDEVLEYIKFITKSVLRCGQNYYGFDYFKVIFWSYSLGIISNDDPVFRAKLKDWVFDYSICEDEFAALSEIVVIADSPPSALTMKLKQQFIEYLSKNITNEVVEAGFFSGLYSTNLFEDYEITNYVKERFEELEIIFDHNEAIYVAEHCNIEDIIVANEEAAEYEEDEGDFYRDQMDSKEATTDIIDDLFERP